MKSLVTMLIALAIILTASFLENSYLIAQFEYFDKSLDVIIEDTQNKIDSSDKLKELSDWWKKEKNTMHAFVPHNDIKDIDGMLAEAESFISTGMFNTATARLKKLDDIITNIPETFSFSLGNIF